METHALDSAEELTNEALLRRSAERLGELLPSDPELEALRPSAEAIARIQSSASTIETVAKAFELYADRPCLGEREVEIVDGELRPLGAVRKHRYREIWARIEALASGLAHEGAGGPGSFVGIIAFGSPDWVVADFAALHRASVSVPLQTTLSSSDLEQILRETEIACLFCSVEELEAVDAVLPRCPSVATLVLIDTTGAEARVLARKRAAGGPRVFTIEELEAIGRARGPVPMTLPSARGEPDPLMSLTYTSGSTGLPKGAMYTERLLCDLWQRGFSIRLFRTLTALPHLTVSYMPLNHAAGRMNIMTSVVRGGCSVFVAKSDMSTLFEDIQLVRPTNLFVVPRVAATIYQHYQTTVVRRSAGVADENERVRIAGEVLREMRSSFLGDRLLFMSVGSAPTPPETVLFLKRCFEAPVVDGYGSTEAGPITFDNRVDADIGLEWRLVDVPELGYRTTDQPYPRGELHVKSRFLVPGYYKNERATKELFDADGYLVTGDIVEQRAEDRLFWIDRAKNVLKLSQGEFVATSRLEGLFASKSPFIKQIFVYGDSFHSYLLAVVVPDLEAASSVLRTRGEPVTDAALKALVRADMSRIAGEEQLRGYEVPRDIVLEREPFTETRGLLTPSNKQSRPRLLARYRDELEALYRAIERSQIEQLYGLEGASKQASIGDEVRRAIAVTLGLPELEIDALPRSFLQLGGDSLSVVGLSSLVHDLTGVRIPVGLLLDPTSSVQSIIAYVERELGGARRHAPTFAEIHGAGATKILAEDVRLERFLGEEEIAAVTPAAALPARREVALLTGANGFLGRFLALELLDRLGATPRQRVYAIVRARDDAAALERLSRAYRTDPTLAKRFDALVADGKVVALAGDLMKPRLGLAGDAYERLAEEVDVVVHAGALVNHALGYEQLFEPNVIGTLEVLRFALARRRKTLAYVSTVGVSAHAPEGTTEVAGQDGYAAGYATSKWVSELLLRDAQRTLGLPLLVFRPSEIMAHSAYQGQVNVPDFFTRLIAGIVYTGIAPRSFYRPGVAEHASFDGLPVDVVARSIAAISVAQTQDERVFNVANPHRDDGISLDVIVSWVKTAGYPVRRIPEYGAWYQAFVDRLQSLPEEKRHHSPLAILEAWHEPQGAPQAIDTAPLLEALRAIDERLAEIPHVSEALIHRMLDDMAALHVIDAPYRLAG